MSLDLCAESYGSLAPFLSSDSVGALLRASTLSRRRSNPSDRVDAPDASVAAVLRAADALPILLLQALWLVDICRLSYEDAAQELSIPREVLAERVRQGREAIHLQLVDRVQDTDRPKQRGSIDRSKTFGPFDHPRSSDN